MRSKWKAAMGAVTRNAPQLTASARPMPRRRREENGRGSGARPPSTTPVNPANES